MKTVDDNLAKSLTEALETKTPINLNYMSGALRAFHSCPLSKDHGPYLTWLTKVEKEKSQLLKEMGLYDMIQLSRVGPGYGQNMVIASLYFWDSTHNTFHFPCGILTTTLFNIVVIAGFRPTGEVFDPSDMNENTINFDTNRAAFTHYISDHHNTKNDEVSNEEHIALLALWLSRCILCSKSLQVAKRFLTHENQLHVGRNIYLSQLILGSVCKSLGEAVEIMKTYQPGTNLLLASPYLLLQLWLNTTFEPSLLTYNTIN